MRIFIALIVIVPSMKMLVRSQGNTSVMLDRSGMMNTPGDCSYNGELGWGAMEFEITTIFDREIFDDTVRDYLGDSLVAVHHHDPDSSYVKNKIAQMKN